MADTEPSAQLHRGSSTVQPPAADPHEFGRSPSTGRWVTWRRCRPPNQPAPGGEQTPDEGSLRVAIERLAVKKPGQWAAVVAVLQGQPDAGVKSPHGEGCLCQPRVAPVKRLPEAAKGC